MTKIEHLGTGAAYCQLFDSIYPGVIQMGRVDWNTKIEPKYVANFKLLQQGFEKTNHKKYIEVQKLIRCKYQDNLEFAQWFHAMWKMHGGDGQSSQMSKKAIMIL
jgi:microtubule-associated protein, RP/EB family